MLSYIGISCIFGQFDSRYYPLLKIKTPNRFHRGDLVARVVHRTNRSVSWTWGLPDLPGELAYVVHSAHDTRMNGIWLFRNLQNMHFFGGNRQVFDMSTEIKFRCALFSGHYRQEYSVLGMCVSLNSLTIYASFPNRNRRGRIFAPKNVPSIMSRSTRMILLSFIFEFP